MDKQLLEKYVKGEYMSDNERKTVVEWIYMSPENYEEYKALHKIHDILLWNDDVQQRDNKPAKGNDKIKKYILPLSRYAAVLIIAILGSYIYFSHFEKQIIAEDEVTAMHSLYVPPGQRAELLLPDGTKVWLNAKTKFTFPEKFDKKHRNVYLDGEAYFDVEKDEKRPFTVSTEEYDIKVLGTEFNVMAYKGSGIFGTSLLEGSVEIVSHNNNPGCILEPNNIAYSHNNEIKTMPLTDKGYLLWKEGIIYFDNETVDQIMTKLELYFDIKIEVRNKPLLTHRYSGKFRTKDGVEQVLKVLQLKHKFQYKRDDTINTIIIT